jgi:plastocyanin
MTVSNAPTASTSSRQTPARSSPERSIPAAGAWRSGQSCDARPPGDGARGDRRRAARRHLALVGTILGGILLASSVIDAAQTEEARVKVENFSFAPAEITVAPGTKVTWENRDDIPHTVTDAGNPRAFKSPALDTGDTFSYVFSAAGTYHYFCSLHPHMQGTVMVK